ncbi:LysR family transcriptional regulator [Nocardia gipuzkoensis]
MELRQLMYFEAVVRCGGFTRAAEQLHVAQPAISAQIKRLEQELGTPLLERTTRRLALTTAGELFLFRVREVLGQIDNARAEVSDVAAVLRGSLRIGATPILGRLDLPRLLATFHLEYPGVTLSLETGRVADLLHALNRATIDVMIGPIHADLPDHFVAAPLVEESLVFVSPPGRTKFTTPLMDLAAAAEEPFICLPRGSGLYAILTTAATEAGFTPHIPFTAPTPAAIRELVAAGLGVALLAESAARLVGPTIDVHGLRNPPKHPPIGLIHDRRRPLSAAAQAWRRHIRGTIDHSDHARSAEKSQFTRNLDPQSPV